MWRADFAVSNASLTAVSTAVTSPSVESPESGPAFFYPANKDANVVNSSRGKGFRSSNKGVGGLVVEGNGESRPDERESGNEERSESHVVRGSQKGKLLVEGKIGRVCEGCLVALMMG